MSEVIVIGGGAAGMAAALSAAENGHHVRLLEQNEKLGKKIYITGKGRCNVTNACDFDTFVKQIVSNERFMYSSLRAFSNEDLYRLLEDGGCPLKIERGERVFPVSDHASDVTRAFERMLRAAGVEILLDTKVLSVKCPASEPEEREAAPRFAVLCLQKARAQKQGTHRSYAADAVIVCTGGVSYSSTGATGDGYRFAKDAGLSVTKPVPALVPLVAAESDCKELMGVSLKNIAIRISALSAPEKTVCEDFGEMLFTHFGISGPVVLSASSRIARRIDAGERFVLSIDLKPALTEEQLDARILRDFASAQNMNLENALGKLLLSSLRPVILRRAGIPGGKKVHEVSRKERERLLHAIKHLDFTICGTRGFAEAIITQGGVDVKAVNPKTMESKCCKGLYFAGEVLDVDALTGGFNLQLAWSTGHAAGASVPW